MSEQIRALDPINPQVAARVVRYFERWKRFDPQRQTLMRAELGQIRAIQGLSKESSEIVGKILS